MSRVCRRDFHRHSCRAFPISYRNPSKWPTHAPLRAPTLPHSCLRCGDHSKEIMRPLCLLRSTPIPMGQRVPGRKLLRASRERSARRSRNVKLQPLRGRTLRARSHPRKNVPRPTHLCDIRFLSPDHQITRRPKTAPWSPTSRIPCMRLMASPS